MKTKRFKRGDYVTDGRDKYRVVFHNAKDGLCIESCDSECFFTLEKPVGLKRCAKPKTFKQDHTSLCKFYGESMIGKTTSQAKTLHEFSGKLIALMRKHGQSIHL